ncbi:hypothetical protein [Ruminococcus sp. YRD2003]|uniref:hypothetical protein n=1 Tax=Ruminococcus sp. YRD2003 TaxID=1452313 RepID=UPI0015A517F6
MIKTERERFAPAADQARLCYGFAGSRTVYGLVLPGIFLDLTISLSVFFCLQGVGYDYT